MSMIKQKKKLVKTVFFVYILIKQCVNGTLKYSHNEYIKREVLGKMAEKTTRINFNATPTQKKELVRLAKKHNATLTNYILTKCLQDDPADHYQLTIKDMEIQHLQEKLETLQKEHNDLKQMYQITHNAMLWHSLPFFKKLGKRNDPTIKELTNK